MEKEFASNPSIRECDTVFATMLYWNIYFIYINPTLTWSIKLYEDYHQLNRFIGSHVMNFNP